MRGQRRTNTPGHRRVPGVIERMGHTMNRAKTAALLAVCLTALWNGGSALAQPNAVDGTNAVSNGDFEQAGDDAPASWTVSGEAAPEAVSGVWRRLSCTFRSGPYETVAFSIEVPRGASGSVWVDNLVVGPEQVLRNPGFEEVDAQGALVGWQYSRSNGTVFADATRASEGTRSLRITHEHEAVPMTLILQDIPVAPGREYTLSLDMFVGDDFQGEAKGWLWDPTHHHSISFDYGNLLASTLVAERDRLGRYAVALRPRPGAPVELSQEVTVEPDANLSAGLDFDTGAFRGALRYTIEDAASGRTLRRFEVSEGEPRWQKTLAPLTSVSPRLRVRISAEGEGLARIDNVAVTPPVITPPFQHVRWFPASESFIVPDRLGVRVRGQAGKPIEGGLSLLAEDFARYGGTVERTDTEGAPMQLLIGPEHAVEGRGDEAYTLTVGPGGVSIRAGREAGAFYGLMSVLQLLQEHDGKPVLPACEVTDYPDMPMRGMLYGDAEQAARWKMNTLMVSTGYPTTPAEIQAFRELTERCRGLKLQLIPYFLTLGGGYWVQKQNPNLVAGDWVRAEQLVLHGTEPTPLANPYVIRTQLTDVVLADADGVTTYQLGKDYQVIDGDMAHPYNSVDPKPFAVARVPGSAIVDGGTVLASYDCVRPETHIAYVPLEPEVRELMDAFLTGLVGEFPITCVNTSCCLHEFRPTERQLARDSRVIASGKQPIELLVDEVRSQDAALKRGNPEARVLQWAGNVGDYVRAAGPHLPEGTLINIWGYDANWPATYGTEAIKYWTGLGFETSVMPWDNLRNVRGWAQVVAEARRRGYPCLGMIGSAWAQRSGGFAETAIVSWRVPREGEARFVAVPWTSAREQ